MHRQQGMATLVVSLLLMISATAFSFYTAKSKLVKIKLTKNDFQHKQAYAKAEEGLDYAGLMLRASQQDNPLKNGNNPVDFKKILSNAGKPETFLWSGAKITAELWGDKLILVISTGKSDDGEASVTMERAFYVQFYSMGGGKPEAPLMANSHLYIQGSTTVDSNPEGPYANEPLSIWIKGGLNFAGHLDTNIQDGHGGYSDSYTIDHSHINNSEVTDPAATLKLDEQSSVYDDIRLVDDTDAKFPEDLMLSTLGIPSEKWPDYRAIVQAGEGNKGDRYIKDCNLSQINRVKDTRIIVTGDCAQQQAPLALGSNEKPVILIFADAVNVKQALNVTGLLYILNTTDTPPVEGGQSGVSGSINVTGAMVVDTQQMGATTGSVRLTYNSDVLDKLKGSELKLSGKSSGWVPGTWRDFTN